MSKLAEKIPGIIVLVLGVISVILVGLIYFGGSADSITVGQESLAVPKFTDALLYWAYFLIALTLGITVVLTLYTFVKKFIDNPVDALKGLIPIAIFVLVFVVAWSLGSSHKVSIIGYEGDQNFGDWAKFTDMLIYSIYALFIGLAVTIVGAAIYTKLK